jgi:hypothetical protein
MSIIDRLKRAKLVGRIIHVVRLRDVYKSASEGLLVAIYFHDCDVNDELNQLSCTIPQTCTYGTRDDGTVLVL